jgi:ribosomal protein S18 acetylase RimI-like enzyme
LLLSDIPMVTIARAVTEVQFQQVRELIAELIEWDSSRVKQLGLDAQEMLDFYHGTRDEALPGVYSPPDGCLLIATCSAKAAGCGAFHRLTSDTCEMQRMYVRPEFRGMRIGRRLAETLIATAREAGYVVMRLETTTFMESALALYSSLGFRTCEPYYSIPRSFREITVFMELNLRGAK